MLCEGLEAEGAVLTEVVMVMGKLYLANKQRKKRRRRRSGRRRIMLVLKN